jgi:predicted transcriptional regulator
VPRPEGKLTHAQHEILEAVWATKDAGASVTEIWEAIAKSRSVTRTTVLNLVDRLEKRGWLRRKKADGAFRYLATVDAPTTARRMAEGFVDEFFGGSASDMVMSLLGGKRLTPQEAKRLRGLLDSAAQEGGEDEP